MRNEIAENKEFYIISRSIDNAEKCKVVRIFENYFDVKLRNYRKYEIDESVELFSMTPHGQLYFETIVKEVQNDIISIWFPISSRYLQRREYTRIPSDKNIILYDNEKNIPAKISDIGAGGLKIVTSEQLELLKKYGISIVVENKEIKTNFQPIRIEAFENEFISSGRFDGINNYDRIALVQYCFRKQAERFNSEKRI